MSEHHQIIVSGLGGQGVLFITKLLAGAAMAHNHPVLTSETHGMAQRGGNVISYLKIGDCSGPLIRPGKADGLIALKEESFHHHNYFLKPGGIAAVNCPAPLEFKGLKVRAGDAETLANQSGSPQSVNVVMLGFFTAAMAKHWNVITLDSLARVIQEKFKGKKAVSNGILDLLESGYRLY